MNVRSGATVRGLLALALLSGCGDDNGPSTPLPNLVFREATPEGVGRIVQVTADGSDRIVLWEGGAEVQDVTVAPDGRILFLAFEGWQLIPAGGGTATPFAVPDDGAATHPAWAPDGASLGWIVVPEGGTFAVATAAPNSSAAQVLTPDSLEVHLFAWSPDGTRLVFASQSLNDGADYGLYTISRDGSNLRRITPDTLTVVDVPSWSPAGDRIAFLSGDVFTVAPDGSDLRRLTHGVTGDIDGFHNGVYWSPVGDELLTTGTHSGRLSKINVATGAQTPLGLVTVLSNPWSLDGTRVFYGGVTASLPPRPAVSVALSDGTQGAQVSPDGVTAGEPSWMPESQ